jgi:hypothetical protein
MAKASRKRKSTSRRKAPQSERVKFTRNYDHTWPSRAMSSYPDNWEGRVPRAVAAAAVKAGAAVRVGTASTATTRPLGPKGGELDGGQPAEKLPGNLDPALAEPQALTPNLHNANISE